jgi:Sugar kinases, ribokinase family
VTDRVVVVGDVIDDVHVVTEGPIRPDTDTLADITVRPGGSAANTACWLGSLGDTVTFYGRVGGDDVARHRVEFERFGVDAALQIDTNYSTGTIIVIVQGSTRTMLSDRGANLTLDVTGLEFPDDTPPRVLHLTGYSFFHRDDPSDLIRLMDRVRDAGGDVVLDASSRGFLSDHGATWWWEIATHATIVRANEDEAEFLTGHTDDDAACVAMAEHGPHAILTRAEEGAVCVERGGAVQRVPAAPLGPDGLVDPTGAGDAFSAGLIHELVAGASLVDAVRRGVEVSAQVVSQRGSRPL